MLLKASINSSAEHIERLQQTHESAHYTTSKISNNLNEIASNNIWNYFKQSDNDLDKAMCLLCCKESDSHNSAANFISNALKDANHNDVLWEHLRLDHCIDRTTTVTVTTTMNGSQSPVTATESMLDAASTSSNQDEPSYDYDKEQQQQRQNHNNILTQNRSAPSKSIDSVTSNKTSSNKGHTHHTLDRNHHNYHKYNKHKQQSASSSAATISNNNQDSTKLRRSLDLIDYDNVLQLRMKPSANSSNTTSLSKNFMLRLNELSSPVARRLKFWNKKSFQVNQYDPSFKVIYLGNLGIQFLSKDEHCLEKPLNTLWNNYLVYMKTEIVMRLTICNSGLKAITRQHGLTQYWSNRLVYCFTHKNYPKIFSWIYRHEGKKMRQELRCHAVFCSSPEKASKMVALLNQRLTCALQEFRREKKSREPPSIMTKSDHSKNSNMHQLLQQTLPRTVPLRRQILAKGSANFRPPLDRSKSAPKLTSIREEECDEDDETAGSNSSHDEFEFEQSFGDGEDGDDDDNDEYGYDNEEALRELVDNLNLNEHHELGGDARLTLGSDSLLIAVNEVTTRLSDTVKTTCDDSHYNNQPYNQSLAQTIHEEGEEVTAKEVRATSNRGDPANNDGLSSSPETKLRCLMKETGPTDKCQ